MSEAPEELEHIEYLPNKFAEELAARQAAVDAEAAAMQRVNFVRYDEAGEVYEWGYMALAAIEAERAAGKSVAIGGGTADFWVDVATGEVNPKAECPAYLDEAALVVRACPIPCRVQIGRDVYDCDDGEAELEITQPGLYSVTVRSVRYLPKTFMVAI
jgi:hypothetical protein